MRRDPFAVDDGIRQALLADVVAELDRPAGVVAAQAGLHTKRQHRHFGNIEGSRQHQHFVETGAMLMATAAGHGDVQRRSYPNSFHGNTAAAGNHVLCEKPVAHDHRQVVAAADLAQRKGLKTKLGFTFRYAPATMYAAELIADGFIGEPYLINCFEQNSQWLDPATPLRQTRDADPDVIAVSSIEGYGAPVIDIMHWWLNAPLRSVVGTMRNFVPERVVRETGRMTRMNIDDGDMWIAEFDGGKLASVQSSYVTVGNYPGIEVRIYGSRGAIIVRLVEEAGICQTIRTAAKDAVEFVEREIPPRFFPDGGHSGEPWPLLFYSNLVSDFATEILSGDGTNQGDFRQGALVQQTINAFEHAHRARAWVDFPLVEARLEAGQEALQEG